MKDSDFDELMKFNPFDKTEYYPIKSKILNGLLGGNGLPKGSTLHIAGGSGTGKSTLVLHDLCKDLLAQGLDIAYIDADRGINTDIMGSTGILPYFKNTDKKVGGCFLVFRETTFKEINDLIQTLVDKGIQIIVLDTLSIIDSGYYLGKNGGDIENLKVGGEAQKLRQLMKNINVLAEHDSRKTNFILLNHTAKEIGGFSFGPPKETPKGGEAPIQYSDIVIQLYRYSSKSETYNDKPIGQKVYAEIVKSRHATGKVKTPFFIRYGKGISNILTYKEIIEDRKLISIKGRTSTVTLPGGKTFSFVGKDNLTQAIIDNYSDVDTAFTTNDWLIDVTSESAVLDIEYNTLNNIKLPKDLQQYKVVTMMGDLVYFLTGIDSLGQKYGIYYNTKSKVLKKEFNSSTEEIIPSEIEKSKIDIENYLEELKKDENNLENASSDIDSLLDKIE
jgi:recombination protein RecA